MVDYHVVFDVATSGYSTWWTGFPFIGVAAIMMIAQSLSESRARRRWQWILVAAPVVLGIGAQVLTALEYNHLRTRLRAGQYENVEGSIEYFRPGADDGHPSEIVTVNGRSFNYSPYQVTNAFHTVAGRGGPMRQGLRVRIANVEGKIARLEVEDGASGHDKP